MRLEISNNPKLFSLTAIYSVIWSQTQVFATCHEIKTLAPDILSNIVITPNLVIHQTKIGFFAQTVSLFSLSSVRQFPEIQYKLSRTSFSDQYILQIWHQLLRSMIDQTRKDFLQSKTTCGEERCCCAFLGSVAWCPTSSCLCLICNGRRERPAAYGWRKRANNLFWENCFTGQALSKFR